MFIFFISFKAQLVSYSSFYSMDLLQGFNNIKYRRREEGK